MKRIKNWLGERKGTLVSALLVCSLLLAGCSGDLTDDGEAVVEQSQYGILVINQNGEVVSDAEVSLDGTTVTTNDSGYATFTKPDVATTALTIICTDYYTYSNANYSIKSGASDSVTIKSKSLKTHQLKSAIYKNGLAKVDLLEGCKKVNQSTSNMDFDIQVAVLGDEDTVSCYELHQQTETEDKVIATAADGNFTKLKVKDFSVGTNVFVTVCDNANHRTTTALNLEIGENPNFNEFSELSFGDSLSFTVSDKIPIFGGSTFELGMPSLPIDYKFSEDKVHIGFNISEDTFDDESQMKEYKELLNSLNRARYAKDHYKELVQQLKRRQKKKGLMSMSGFDKGIDVTVSGYAEAGFDSFGQLSEGTGYLCVTLSASAEFDWQLVVWCVPVVVDVTGEVTADLADTISYNFSENKFTGDSSLTLSPSLNVKAGVGFEYLSAGVYGEASLETKLVLASLEEEPGFTYVDMTSSVGVYAKAAFLETNADLLTGTFNLWKRADKTKTSSSKENSSGTMSLYRDMYNIKSYAPIQNADHAKMKTASYSNYDYLSSGLHFGASPVSASNGSTALTVFVSQDEIGDSDISYSKLYYSLYEDGEWSDGTSLSTIANNEMNPQLVSDGTDYYLIYQETDFDNSIFDNYSEKDDAEKKAILKKAFNSIDIHVQKFDSSTKTFIDLGKIQTTGKYDYNASIVLQGSTPYVYFGANSNGDFFATSEEKSNTLYQAVYSQGLADNQGEWEVSAIDTKMNAITKLQAGVYNSKVSCMYAVDNDNDLLTSDDLTLYLYNGTSDSKTIAEGAISDIIYDILPTDTSNKQFLISKSTGLYSLNESDQLTCLFEELNNYSNEYTVTDTAIYYTKKSDNKCTEIYARYPLSNGGYSEPIQITDEEKWQRDISAIKIGNTDYVVGLSDEYNVDSDGANVYTRLVSYQIEDIYNFSVDEVVIDYNDTVDAEKIPVTVTLSNQGNQTINAYQVKIFDASDNELEFEESDYAAKLEPGQSTELTLHVAKTENLCYGKWMVQANIVTEDETIQESNTEDNVYTADTGYSDFCLTASLRDSSTYPYVMIEVQNNGNVSDSATVAVLDANDTTKVLNTFDISDLAVGDSKIIKVKLKDEWADANGKLSILTKVIDAEKELYTYNNYEYVYATLNYGTYHISYELDGGKNATDNPATYTTKDSVKFAEPTKRGYSFVGWYTTSSFDTISQISELPSGSAGDVTLYAKWVKNDDSNSNKTDVGNSNNNNENNTIRKKVADSAGSVYTITSVKGKKGTLKFSKPKNKKVKKVIIFDTIKVKGVTYKVTAVAANAFKGCTKLKKVTIGKNVKNIGKKVFYNCKSLQTVLIKTNRLTSKTVGGKAFAKIHAKAKIKVPKKKLKAYKKLLKKKGVTGKKQKIMK